MHWTDNAIILSARKHGETSAIMRVLAREHGVYAGVVRGVHSKSRRGVLQPGNAVSCTWQARLPEQMGGFTCELLKAHAAFLMQDAGRLIALSSACALIEAALPERHPYAALYAAFLVFLNILSESEDWPQAYVRLELTLLAETGFGLDLSCCAATGVTEDLIYVSPKSGRAVSRQAGEPYKDKLLPLPSFLLERGGNKEIPILHAEILAGLRLTGYFLGSWLLEPHRRKLPAARSRVIDIMQKQQEAI